MLVVLMISVNSLLRDRVTLLGFLSGFTHSPHRSRPCGKPDGKRGGIPRPCARTPPLVGCLGPHVSALSSNDACSVCATFVAVLLRRRYSRQHLSPCRSIDSQMATSTYHNGVFKTPRLNCIFLADSPRKHYTADGAARQSQPTQATAAEYSVSGRMGIEPDILSMETPPTGLEGIGLAKFGPHLSPDEVSHGEGARTASTQMPGLLQLEHPDVRGVGAQPPAGVSNVISSLPAAASAPSSPLSSTVVDVVARAGTVDTTIGCTSDRVATLASGLAGTADSTPAATAGLPSFPRESREGDLETAALPGEAVEARSTDVADEASTAAASAEAAPATAPQGRPSFVVETVGAGGAGGRFGPTAGVGKFHGGEAAPLPLPGRVVGSPAAATREQGHMWVRELDSAAESRVASLELTPPETVAISPRNTSAVVVGTREGAESPRGWGEMRDTVTAAESVAADSKPLAVAKAAPTAVTGGEGYRNPWEEVSVPTSAGSASIRSRGGAGHTRTDTLHPPLPFHGGLPFPAEVENGEGVIRMGIVPPRPRASDKREAAFEGDASGPAASWGDSSSGVRRWSIGGGGARRGSPLPDGRRREVGVARDRWGVGALDGEGRGGAEGMRSSMPWSWGAGPAPESSGKQRLTKSDRGGAQGRSESFPKVGRVLGGGGGGVMVVDRREREALLRENDDLRRQVDLTQKRRVFFFCCARGWTVCGFCVTGLLRCRPLEVMAQQHLLQVSIGS